MTSGPATDEEQFSLVTKPSADEEPASNGEGPDPNLHPAADPVPSQPQGGTAGSGAICSSSDAVSNGDQLLDGGEGKVPEPSRGVLSAFYQAHE